MARRAGPLNALAEKLGDSFLPLPCDVRDLLAVERAVGTAKEKFGRIDILINNAGVGRFGPIDELRKEDWDELMDTNVTGLYHVTREVVPIMKKQGSGHILNIASIAGLLGNPNLGGYNASKFAVRGLTEALFKELRDFGIKVSGLYPGSVATNFSGSSHRATYKMDPAEVAAVGIHVLERSENFLISDVVMRPLKPRG